MIFVPVVAVNDGFYPATPCARPGGYCVREDGDGVCGCIDSPIMREIDGRLYAPCNNEA